MSTFSPGRTPGRGDAPAELRSASTAAIATALADSRAHTLALVDDLTEADQTAQHSPLMSPLVWDLAHIGNYEEQWLVRAVGSRPAREPQLDDVYDAFQHPRASRPDLALLGPADARRYLEEIRADTLDVLAEADLTGRERLTAGGFVYGMVAQHEHQHGETMLATRQLMGARAPAVPGAQAAPPAPGDTPAGEIEVAGGTHEIGTSTHPWALDNERGAHEVALAPFRIDVAPVTNAGLLAFIEDGGYRTPQLWTADGWAWCQEAGLSAPQFWQAEGGGTWSLLRFGQRIDLAQILHQPAQHVCWFEADAWARWAGRRLPTELEWEAAAAGATTEGANVGRKTDGPAPAGAFPGGTSAVGCQQMLGDVWEWTSSDLHPWPGFEAYPYREYSEVFWGGDYKVLRGGSWAAHPLAVRTTFRNWDHPIRRQIFSGFRTAADA